VALDARTAAAGVIGDVLGGLSLNRALPARLDRVDMRDRSLLQQLCYGTLRDAPRLQAILGQLLDKPLRDKDRDLQGLLLCGLHQLDSTRVPDHAAVAATVEATRTLKKQWAKGMTNAVLRRFLREREALVMALDAAASASHPPWLYEAICRQWPTAADAILDANNHHPPMTLRVNAQHSSREAYLALLQQQGLSASASAISADAIRLSQAVDVGELPGFWEGHISVQDEAAQMAAPLLQARPGDRVLDACAAPGGKTGHLLELQPGIVELVAMDIDDARLSKVHENLQRLDLKATLLPGDAANPPAVLAAESFDRILVDAPCSASGVIRRHPDVKLLRRNSDIQKLAEQQLNILKGLWPLLKVGGRMLYVTCSILEEENSQLVGRFLEQHPNARPEAPDVLWGEMTPLGRQLLPTRDGSDGLFYCTLIKT
jgi:16S rRNA (cytosine967-C5)-methyltransferase